MVHELKTLNPYFEDVWSGKKDFELRRNDRDFKVGDRLKLLEYEPGNNQYVPRYILKDVKYILKGGVFGLSSEYVILGLKDIKIG